MTAQESGEILQNASDAIEPHFTVAEVAAMWSLSSDSVRRIFRRQPGVLVLETPRPSTRKRAYETLRIPQSVLERVHRQFTISK
jgi:hypothetical protein